MATFIPATSMGTNLLYAVKGDSNLAVIDHTAPYDATAYAADAASFTAGRGMVLSTGKWIAGIAAVTDIPYLAFSGLDVNNLPDVLRTKGMPYSGAGKFGCWSVFNKLRIATTALDTTATFAVGVPVTISKNDSGAGKKGLVTTLGAATDVVIGYVGPNGKFTNEHGVSVVEIDLHYVRGTTMKTIA